MKSKPAGKILPKRVRRPREPVELRLTVRFKFGDEPQDVVTMMQDRRVPMVDSVFKSRDRIFRAFTVLMLRAAAAQPKVARELVPLLKMLRRKPKRPAGRGTV